MAQTNAERRLEALLDEMQRMTEQDDWPSAIGLVVDIYDTRSKTHRAFGPLPKDTSKAILFGQGIVDAIAESTPDEPRLEFNIAALFNPANDR